MAVEELELDIWFEENACSVRMLAVFVDDFVLYDGYIGPAGVEELQLIFAKRSRPWGQYHNAGLARL
jgi:hypothetical protein